MNPEKLEPFTTISEHVPEHMQFVHMMYDVQAQAQRRKEALGLSQEEQSLSNQIATLSVVATIEGSTAATTSTSLALSAIQNTFYELGPDIGPIRPSTSFGRKTTRLDDTSAVTPRSLQAIDRPRRSGQTITRPVFTNAAAINQAVMNQPGRPSPRLTHITVGAKEMWQEVIQEDREEQETTVSQIEDSLEEDRPW